MFRQEDYLKKKFSKFATNNFFAAFGIALSRLDGKSREEIIEIFRAVDGLLTDNQVKLDLVQMLEDMVGIRLE